MNNKNCRFIYIACAFTGEKRSNNKFCSSIQNWNVKKMNKKTTSSLVVLTAISLFIAPQVVRSDQIMPALLFMPFLFLGLLLTVVIKNLSNPG